MKTEVKIHLKKFGLRGGAARQPMASATCGTTMQDPWLRRVRILDNNRPSTRVSGGKLGSIQPREAGRTLLYHIFTGNPNGDRAVHPSGVSWEYR